MIRGRWSMLAVAAVLALLPTGCTRGSTGPGPLTAGWRPVALPPVPDGRLTLGEVLACGGRWYALGGVRTTAGGTRPAAWTSIDGRSWTPLPLRATTSYGPQQVFVSAACSQDRVAALGGTSGGVHGNPRYNTWWGDAGGLTDVPSGLDLFGGQDALSVGRIAGGAGPSRYLIAGSWNDAANRPHAVAWASADGTRFDRRDSDPALASDASTRTEAASAAYAGDEWLLAGDATRAGNAVTRDPVAWSSTDAISWRREEVSHSATVDEALQRITPWAGTALAIGVRGGGFGAWQRDPATRDWRAAGGFGRFTGNTVPGVTGVAVAADRAKPIVYVAGADGTALRLWASTDAATWRPVRLPAGFPAGAGRTLLVAERAGRLLLAAENGTSARLWLADSPA